jgi:hypothetical protein
LVADNAAAHPDHPPPTTITFIFQTPRKTFFPVSISCTTIISVRQIIHAIPSISTV